MAHARMILWESRRHLLRSDARGMPVGTCCTTRVTCHTTLATCCAILATCCAILRAVLQVPACCCSHTPSISPLVLEMCMTRCVHVCVPFREGVAIHTGKL